MVGFGGGGGVASGRVQLAGLAVAHVRLLFLASELIVIVLLVAVDVVVVVVVVVSLIGSGG